jgi:gluconokinase
MESGMATTRPVSTRVTIVVIGVVGAGRRRFGSLLAGAANIGFVDGDALPGGPTDGIRRDAPPRGDARLAWLDRVGAIIADVEAYPAGVVVSCSALRRADRDRLRWRAAISRFVYLALEPALHRRINRCHCTSVSRDFTIEQFLSIDHPEHTEIDTVIVDAMLAHNRFAAREVVELDPPIDVAVKTARVHAGT